MADFLAALHWLGTKPLTVSFVAQIVAIFISLKKGEKARVREHLILIGALMLIIVSLHMRPPSPNNTLADGLGTLAAVLLLEPAVFAVRHRKDKA